MLIALSVNAVIISVVASWLARRNAAGDVGDACHDSVATTDWRRRPEKVTRPSPRSWQQRHSHCICVTFPWYEGIPRRVSLQAWILCNTNARIPGSLWARGKDGCVGREAVTARPGGPSS